MAEQGFIVMQTGQTDLNSKGRAKEPVFSDSMMVNK